MTLTVPAVDTMATGVPVELEDLVNPNGRPPSNHAYSRFCAFLSKGTDYRNCGRPCDTHHVQLRDRVGAEHPLKADAGCRNTLFNAVPQSAAEVLPTLLDQGLTDFRIELLDETASDIREVPTNVDEV